MPFKPMTDVLTVFHVILRDRVDPERLLDGSTLVETKGGQIIVGVSDPNAAAKLAARPALLVVKPRGRAVLIGDLVDVDD